MTAGLEPKTVPYHKILITTKESLKNPKETELRHAIETYFSFPIEGIKLLRAYTIFKPLLGEQLDVIMNELFVDPVQEESLFHQEFPLFDWSIEVGYKKGVTDNAGKTAQITIEDYIGENFQEGEGVHFSIITLLKGKLTRKQVEKIATELLANSLIQEIHITNNRLDSAYYETIDINGSDKLLIDLSKQRQLVLNLNEMKAIREHYLKENVQKMRKEYALPLQPTDVELEALAQTWSEHCKHKIFNAHINYVENGKTKEIASLFLTYIKGATDKVSSKIDWLVSVFSDNAGIIRFNEQYNLAFKVETHNSPSALDPYGGALTGILGVNRDIMGAGQAARLIANTNVLCFAPPNYSGPIPERLMPPKRIFEGVRLGIEHGGNKSGVPTVNGSIVFDDSFLGKPLVYCGSVGIMPREINGKPTHKKEIKPGDLIVIAGGRTGKDGIHGATFSSEELHAESPSSAVQIGDPFTQKKLHDFILEARDKEFFRTLTDNGAGGFSSSVGEMAEISNGAKIHLDKALLKQNDMQPWEILLSESQERMTLAVAPDKEQELKRLAKIHEIELCTIGHFTDTGFFHVLFKDTTVGLLSLDFLHNGLPDLQLEATFNEPSIEPLNLPSLNLGEMLHTLLSSYNICSKESVVRQYDHEVQGGSVCKPLVGDSFDGPGDAAVIRPIETMKKRSKEAIAISNGICPRYSKIDAYHMSACAIDEAMRNLVCVGADPKKIAILDNFSWPDPIYEPEKTPDGKEKLGQLVRANQALYDLCVSLSIPIISGKDSMKNDYKMGDRKISVLPTLLISAIGIISDVEKCISMDFKFAGDSIYVIGMTKDELGCSELTELLSLKGGKLPQVDSIVAVKTFNKLYEAIQKGLLSSCHDCSDGGLAVCLAECAFGGNLGAEVNLIKVPAEKGLCEQTLLFAESQSRFVCSVDPHNEVEFEKIMEEVPFSKVGVVNNSSCLEIDDFDGKTLLKENIFDLKMSWQKSLGV